MYVSFVIFPLIKKYGTKGLLGLFNAIRNFDNIFTKDILVGYF